MTQPPITTDYSPVLDHQSQAKNRIYLREAAGHARLHVFPNSVIGRFIWSELDWACQSSWGDNRRALDLAAEVYHLHDAGFTLPTMTSESDS